MPWRSRHRGVDTGRVRHHLLDLSTATRTGVDGTTRQLVLVDDPAPGLGRVPVVTAHLLGTFRVSIEGVPVDTEASRRVRHLIAYLLTHRRAPVHRDVLMNVFWPNATPAAARNNLHVTLSALRQVLRAAGPHAVVERRFDAYRIGGQAAVWTDMEQFERLCDAGAQAERYGDGAAARHSYEAAGQLYEGDLLAEEPYLEWAAPIRETLRLTAIATQIRLVDSYLDRDDPASAATVARRVVAMDPCNELAHRQLLRCYAALDQRHLALAQYSRMTGLLWTSLRVAPSVETTALFQRLRQPGGRAAGWHGPSRRVAS